MSETLLARADRLRIRDLELEVVRRGTGQTLIFLHGFHPLGPESRFLELLSRRFDVLAPSHPGFGASSRPLDFESVYDLVHLYRELIDGLPGEKITLVGTSFGGWLAAEIAITCQHRLDRLVLVDALGLKLGDRETSDILDIFNTHPDVVRQRSWHDASRAPDFNEMSDEALTRHARDWDALSLYGWEPYMYNPRLKRWLGRIAVPTLVLWGASDGLVTPDYGRRYAALIPGARFALINGAGHHPDLEQPEALAGQILEFLGH